MDRARPPSVQRCLAFQRGMEGGEAEGGGTSQAPAEADEWTRTKSRKGGPCGAHRGLLTRCYPSRAPTCPHSLGDGPPPRLLAGTSRGSSWRRPAFTSLQGDRLIYAESLLSLQADVQASSRAGRRGARVWWTRVSADPQMSVLPLSSSVGATSACITAVSGLTCHPWNTVRCPSMGLPSLCPWCRDRASQRARRGPSDGQGDKPGQDAMAPSSAQRT